MKTEKKVEHSKDHGKPNSGSKSGKVVNPKPEKKGGKQVEERPGPKPKR